MAGIMHTVTAAGLDRHRIRAASAKAALELARPRYERQMKRQGWPGRTTIRVKGDDGSSCRGHIRHN